MDQLIRLLEEIRDHQKLQLANYERALAAQEDAVAIQRRAKSVFLFLTIMPWLLSAGLLVVLILRPHLGL